MALDPALAEGYMAMGLYYNSQTWDAEPARSHVAKAYELDANDTEVPNFYSDYFRENWGTENVLKIEGSAAERDPLSPPNKTDLAELYVWLGDMTTARRLCEEALRLNPTCGFAYEQLVMIAYLEKQSGELQQHLAGLAAYGDTARITYFQTLRCILLQDAGLLAATLAKLTSEIDAGIVPAYHLAFVYHELGDLENMAKWFRFRPEDLGLNSINPVRSIAKTIANHPDPAIRAILDRPGHKAFFDARIARLR